MRGVDDIWELVVDIINVEFIRKNEPLTVATLQQIIKLSSEQLTEEDPTD